MTRAPLATLAALTTCAVLASAPRTAYAQKAGGKDKPPDEVVTRSGDTKRGEVTAETPRELQIKVGEKTQKVEWRDVDRVTYGGTPSQVLPSTVTAADAPRGAPANVAAAD